MTPGYYKDDEMNAKQFVEIDSKTYFRTGESLAPRYGFVALSYRLVFPSHFVAP